MDVLSNIGVNHTFFIQFVLFIIVFNLILRIHIKPYFAAYMERVNKTEGATQKATGAQKELVDLEERFESLVQSNHKLFSEKFGVGRKMIADELHQKFEVTQTTLNEAKVAKEKELAAEVHRAKDELKTVSSELAQAVFDKMIGSSR